MFHSEDVYRSDTQRGALSILKSTIVYQMNLNS